MVTLQSESITELLAALLKARPAFQTPKRTRTGQAGQGKYKYADLDAVIEAVTPVLTENGLLLVNLMDRDESGAHVLIARLYHTSGQWMESRYPVHENERGSASQKFGSGVTYARRYALSALLGIASEDDDDAQETHGATRSASAPQGAANGQQQAAPAAPFPYFSAERQAADPNVKKLAGEMRAFLQAEEAAGRAAAVREILAAVARERQIPPGPFSGEIAVFASYLDAVMGRARQAVPA